jgi:hypothetical protein
MPITSQLVKDFYAAALTKYNAKLVNKDDSAFMKIISSFLDGIGVLDKDKFMNEFVTTIGATIYVPYEVGMEGKWNLWGQISVLTHELTHCEQFHDSPAEFMIKYIVNKSDRATYEAQAYGTDLEMKYWFTPGQGYDIKKRAQSLLNYGLQQQHCDYAAEHLAIYDDVFKQGGGVSPVAAWAKEWLNVHGAK